VVYIEPKETEQLTITKILQIAIPIAGVSVTAISLALTLGARKKELTCAYLGVEKVVSLDVVGNDPSLKIEYQSQPISSLLKLKYVLRNTGGAAIKAEDRRKTRSVALLPARSHLVRGRPFAKVGSTQRGRVVRPACLQSFSHCQMPGVL